MDLKKLNGYGKDKDVKINDSMQRESLTRSNKTATGTNTANQESNAIVTKSNVASQVPRLSKADIDAYNEDNAAVSTNSDINSKEGDTKEPIDPTDALESVGDKLSSGLKTLSSGLSSMMRDNTAQLSGIASSLGNMSDIQRKMYLQAKRESEKPNRDFGHESYSDTKQLKNDIAKTLGQITANSARNESNSSSSKLDFAAAGAAGLYGLKKVKDAVLGRRTRVTNTSPSTQTTTPTRRTNDTRSTRTPRVGGRLGRILSIGAMLAGASSISNLFDGDETGDSNVMGSMDSPQYRNSTYNNTSQVSDIRNIGQVSERFESGNLGAGAISSGRGDAGGVSYGINQLSSNRGTLQKYIKQSEYSKEFKGLAPGSKPFNDVWKRLAKTDEEGFANSQRDFIRKTHYTPQMEKLRDSGIDLSGRSRAVQEAVLSTSVQFGANTSLIKKALRGTNKPVSELSDKEIITSIQNYKRQNNDRLFRSSSSKVRESTYNRASQEQAMLLSMLQSDTTNTSNMVASAKGIPTDIALGQTIPKANDTSLVSAGDIYPNLDNSSLLLAGGAVMSVGGAMAYPKSSSYTNRTTVSSPSSQGIYSNIKNYAESVKGSVVGSSTYKSVAGSPLASKALGAAKAIKGNAPESVSTIASSIKNITSSSISKLREVVPTQSSPAVTSAKNAIKAVRNAGGKFVPGVGTVLGMAEAASIVSDSESNAKEKTTALGGLAGGMALAGPAAALGQTIIPIPGVGLVIGGVVGYALGEYLGSEAASSLLESASSMLPSFGGDADGKVATPEAEVEEFKKSVDVSSPLLNTSSLYSSSTEDSTYKSVTGEKTSSKLDKQEKAQVDSIKKNISKSIKDEEKKVKETSKGSYTDSNVVSKALSYAEERASAMAEMLGLPPDLIASLSKATEYNSGGIDNLIGDSNTTDSNTTTDVTGNDSRSYVENVSPIKTSSTIVVPKKEDVKEDDLLYGLNDSQSNTLNKLSEVFNIAAPNKDTVISPDAVDTKADSSSTYSYPSIDKSSVATKVTSANIINKVAADNKQTAYGNNAPVRQANSRETLKKLFNVDAASKYSKQTGYKVVIPSDKVFGSHLGAKQEYVKKIITGITTTAPDVQGDVINSSDVSGIDNYISELKGADTSIQNIGAGQNYESNDARYEFVSTPTPKVAMTSVISPTSAYRMPSSNNLNVSNNAYMNQDTLNASSNNASDVSNVGQRGTIQFRSSRPTNTVNSIVSSRRTSDTVKRSQYSDTKNVNVLSGLQSTSSPKRKDPITKAKTVNNDQMTTSRSQKPTIADTPIMVNDIGLTLINIGHI